LILIVTLFLYLGGPGLFYWTQWHSVAGSYCFFQNARFSQQSCCKVWENVFSYHAFDKKRNVQIKYLLQSHHMTQGNSPVAAQKHQSGSLIIRPHILREIMSSQEW
jgi:hypothetical protein